MAEKINLPVLVGLHIRENGKLSSGETITKVFEECKSKNWLGLIAACTSPEIIENVSDEIKDLKIPFGFKANLWKNSHFQLVKLLGSMRLVLAKTQLMFWEAEMKLRVKNFMIFQKKWLIKVLQF